jgi:hypothetical protein
MKYTFDSRTLSEKSVSNPERRAVEAESSRKGSSGFALQGGGTRLIVVAVVSMLFLFFFARHMFVPVLAGSLAMAFQAIMVELVFAVLLNRRRQLNERSEERSDRCCRCAMVAWCLDSAVIAAVSTVLVVLYLSR